MIAAIMSWVYTFLWWMAVPVVVIVIGGLLSLPFVLARLFPIRFVLYKNSGGASGNDTIVLYKKIVRKGRIVQTKYGKRVKILGIKDTLPMNICSRENAVAWEAGGVAFIIYEKEIGQFFSVDPHLKNLNLVDEGNKEISVKLKKIYAYLIENYPDLDSYIKLVNPKRAKQIIPVSFANASVKLQPVPTDMITQFTHDVILMSDKYKRQSWMEKYGFYLVSAAVVVLIITTAVLSFDQVNKSIDDRLTQLGSANTGVAQQVASYLANNEAPPGGTANSFIPLIPFIPLFKRRKTRWHLK